MRSIDELGSMTVINLDVKRRPQAAWDKPLTTEFEKDRNKTLVPCSEQEVLSRGRQGQVLVFHRKASRS